MTRVALAALLFLGATGVLAQDAPQPEQCLAKRGDSTAIEVTHAGKTYRMAAEACRAQFLSDPERFSQLYDALLELEAAGRAVAAPSRPSLVPS